MKMIDCHYHVRGWFADGKDYRDTVKEYRINNGLEAVNFLALLKCGGVYFNSAIWQNILAAIQKLGDDKVYAQGALIYPGEDQDKNLPRYDLKAQVQEIMELGLDGVKMLESKPNVYKKLTERIDSDYYREFFAYLEKEQIPLLWHVADPEEFWDETKLSDNAKKNGWFYGDGTFPTREQIYKEVYTILERYPKLNVTFAHFFGKYSYPEEIKKLFDTYENVRIDLAPCPEMFRDFTADREVWKDIFTRYKDRILFGTDADNNLDNDMAARLVQDVSRFLTTSDEYLGFEYYGSEYAFQLKGFELDEDAGERILYGNFIDMMGEQPRKVNKEALKKYIERYETELPEGEIKEMILKFKSYL